MPKSFLMPIILTFLTGLLLSLSLTITALFQNQVEWIFPAFFNWWHLYASWWFSWHILSDMKSLPENFSWCRSSDLFQRFFLLTRTLWKWMGLFLRKDHLLRCRAWLSLLSWIGVLTLSLLLKLPPKRLEPWFVLLSFFLLRLLCISINLLCNMHGILLSYLNWCF